MQPPVITSIETIHALLARSNRKKGVPIRSVFVQKVNNGRRGAGLLSNFVHRRDAIALELYLLFRAVASIGPWDVCLSADVWARALDLGDNPSAVSKIWRRIEAQRLVNRRRKGRWASITALHEDGSGEPYLELGMRGDAYFRVPFEYWTDEKAWHRSLSLPETAMLLIALSRPHEFVLPFEKAKDWYGISADTAERGLHGLERRGLLGMRKGFKRAPLAPKGYTEERFYSLLPPFRTKNPDPATGDGLP